MHRPGSGLDPTPPLLQGVGVVREYGGGALSR